MKKLNYFGAIKFLSKYIGHHKKNFIMFYFGWFFDMLLGIVMPILFGIMIDEIVYHQNLDSFLRISLVFVIMSVFSCVLYFLIYAQHQYLMSIYVYDIQRDIFRHLQKTNAESMSDAKTGDIITIVQHYARECMHFVIRNIIHITNGCINLVLLTLYIFLISPRTGLLMLVAVPVSIIISAKFGKKIRGYSNEQREYYSGYVSYIYEVFTAIRDIRLLGATKKVNRDIIGRHKKMFAVNIKAGVSTITAQNIITGTNLVIQLAIFTLSAYLVSQGNMTIGLLTVVMTYFTALTGQVRMTSGSYLDAQNRVGYIQRIYDFMQSPTEDSWPGRNVLNVNSGEIIADNIAFAYQKSGDILRDFYLHIRPGERFALCGKSGCGKTTFGYMLLGFYSAQNGGVYIDGQSLLDCSLKSIRQNIGMISQDVLLFDGSIKENLLLGKPGASDDEIAEMLRKAGIWEHVSGLPDGIDTVIGSKGVGLSGGQKQRIAIARIYLKNPAIIIFDEATSSLDSETENAIKMVSGTDADLLTATPQSDRMMQELSYKIVRRRGLQTLGTSNRIEFQDVTFAYPDTAGNVVEKLSFSINDGERVGFTGKSGAGKTTVLKLIMGMLYPSSGTVLFSEVDLTKLSLDGVHRRAGFVMQENTLFNASIRENLRYGKDDASDEELVSACQKAFIYDFVKSLPDGFDTVIGERGIKLSGGQKQRIVLARLFLRDVKVFIFDEATSALDQYSESIVHDTIKSISQDKTIIVVAHRESSLALCDRVITL